MRTKIFFVRSLQAFWQSSAPGALSTLVTSIVLYSLTRATLMSPGKDEARVCVYIALQMYRRQRKNEKKKRCIRLMKNES